MLNFPNCKINLGLSITEKRDDGFHNIETVIFPVKLHDALEIIESPDGFFSFSLSGLKIFEDQENNLVTNAYKLLRKESQLPEVHIHLLKKIPMGAGLGGGSADAAFAIKLLNGIFNLNLSNEKMQDYARRLGSDCAFFIQNKPVLATEKGDVMKPFSLDLSSYYFIIVKPTIHIGTPDAYSWIKPSLKENSLIDIIRQPICKWKDYLQNDFEEEVFKRYPEIEFIKNKLYNLGAIYSSMSGSGSAVFGIFEKKIMLHENFPGCFVWQGNGIDV